MTAGSPIAALLDRGKPALPAPAIPQGESFWKEFIRVQCDKFILLLLIVFLHFIHADEQLKYVVGGLIVLTQAQRFRMR